MKVKCYSCFLIHPQNESSFRENFGTSGSFLASTKIVVLRPQWWLIFKILPDSSLNIIILISLRVIGALYFDFNNNKHAPGQLQIDLTKVSIFRVFFYSAVVSSFLSGYKVLKIPPPHHACSTMEIIAISDNMEKYHNWNLMHGSPQHIYSQITIMKQRNII